MASTADQLAALGNDSQFQLRVRGIILNVAQTVYAEAPGTPDTRRQFARQMLTNPDAAQRLAPVVASSPTLVAGTTTFDFANNRPVTNVTDGALVTAVAALWNALAGV
jgi:hypothetical protein